MGSLYRLRQFWRSATAKPLPGTAREEIAAILNTAELALFQQMPDADQRHGYHVCKLLLDSGQSDKNLLAAALLHDVGKARYNLSPWDRTLAVLGEQLLPQKAHAWGEGPAQGWKRTFVIRKQHAGWGAQLASQAGSEQLVIELIGRHQDVPACGSGRRHELLSLLQWADSQC
jgi:HD domain